MKPQENQEVYRIALESANAELTEISTEIDSLSKRKEQIERALVALKPLIPEADLSQLLDISASSAVSSGATAAEQNEPAVEVAVEAAPVQEPLIADPFQRRIDHVLGIGAGIRDVRKYSRQF